MRKSYTKNNLARRISIVILLTVVSVMMLLPQSAMTASAATAGTNKIHQANSVKVARASKKKTSLKTPGTVKHLSFSKYGKIVYVSWNRPAKTSGSALYKVYYKSGSRSWKTRITSSATVRIDVGYHQLLKVKIRTYNRRGSTKKAGAVSSVFKTITAPAGNSSSQDDQYTDPENNSGSQDNSSSQNNSSNTQKDSSGMQDNSSTSGNTGENTHSQTDQTPGVITGISITGSSDGTIHVSWNKPSGNVSSCEMAFKIGNDDWQTADVDIHGEYTLQTGYDKTVLVKVRALNGDRAGSWSAVKSYYMKPEYGYYDIGTDSVTLKVGETKTIPCKYIEGWKGKKAGWENAFVNSVVYQKYSEPLLCIQAQTPGTSTFTLYDIGASGKERYPITIRVTDPKLDAKVDQIKDEMGIRDNMSDLMKAKLAAEWMVKHVDYDYNAIKPGHAAEGDVTIKHVLLDDQAKTICSGYAFAYEYILQDLNVPVKTMTYNGGDHAWNIVKIDGKWYNVDTCWMDAGTSVDYVYFMISYQKLNKFDTKKHHAYYNDPIQAQYRTDDTRFDNWTRIQWENYTDSGDSFGSGAETSSSTAQKTEA